MWPDLTRAHVGKGWPHSVVVVRGQILDRTAGAFIEVGVVSVGGGCHSHSIKMKGEGELILDASSRYEFHRTYFPI